MWEQHGTKNEISVKEEQFMLKSHDKELVEIGVGIESRSQTWKSCKTIQDGCTDKCIINEF